MGGGRAFSAEAQTLFAAMSVQPTTARKILIDQTILSLKASGVWAKFDLLYFFAAHAEQAGLLNWKSPGTFTCTNVSATVFAADRGFTGDGTADHLATGFIPSTHGVQFTQNSAHGGAWARNNLASSTSALLSSAGGAANAFIIPRSAGGNFIARINDLTSSTIAQSTSVGHSGANRSAAGSREFYRDGSAIGGADTTASTAVANAEIFFLRSGANFGLHEISVGHLGASLSAAEWLTLYGILLSYLQAVGAA